MVILELAISTFRFDTYSEDGTLHQKMKMKDTRPFVQLDNAALTTAPACP